MGALILLLVIAVIALLIKHYEKQQVVVEKIIIIALLSALSTVGRILFAAIPNVQPSSFIIIVAGICFGAQIGTMTGIITAFASNLILGHGPWTMMQMFAWGLMGLLSGVMGNALIKYKILRIVYGFVWGFLFGWIMNLYFMVGYASDVGLITYIASLVTAFPFDLAHAIANAVLLASVGDSFIWTFRRIGKKYGMQ